MATERDTPENQTRRLAVAELLSTVKPQHLVFLDESWCTTAMSREHGWAPVGERAIGHRPGRMWRSLSLIGAIRRGCRPKLMTHSGPVDGKVFIRFVRQRLCPWLQRGDVVVMDNLRAHKMLPVREAIEAVGACVVFLPPYSPDMNPIEYWWPDLKRSVRKNEPRTEPELAATVRRLRAQTKVAKIDGWVRHCLRFNQVNRSAG